MRNRCACLLAGLLLAHSAPAWIDYGDRVPETEPGFGKPFLGFALQLHTHAVEFRQGAGADVVVTIRNENPRPTLHPAQPPAERFQKLFLVLADAHGNTLFSGDMLGAENCVVKGRIPRQTQGELVRVAFDTLDFVPVRDYRDGQPVFDPATPRRAVTDLVPQIYTVIAVLLAGPGGKRSDFSLASNPWRILLHPKDGKDMTEVEKNALLERYLKKLREGAYGGIAVSSQLAALGEVAVAPLIRIADAGGGGTTRESRIWAIVTLCNTRSQRGEEYIRKRLRDPVDVGDLNFLAWHSQGLRSPAVRNLLRDLAREILQQSGSTWNAPARKRGAGLEDGFLEFMCKHFASAGLTIDDEIAAGCLQRGNPKVAAFAAAVWEPTSPQTALTQLRPFFLQPMVHPKLQAALLRQLHRQFKAAGAPVLSRHDSVEAVWLQAGIWLENGQRFQPGEFVQFLASQVLSVKIPENRLRLCLELRGGPARDAVPDPEKERTRAWIAAWHWALRSGGFEAPVAIRFLCGEMRAEKTLTDTEKQALLIELKRWLGPDFPLPDSDNIDPDRDWSRCGRWLVENEYFGAGTDAK